MVLLLSPNGQTRKRQHGRYNRKQWPKPAKPHRSQHETTFPRPAFQAASGPSIPGPDRCLVSDLADLDTPFEQVAPRSVELAYDKIDVAKRPGRSLGESSEQLDPGGVRNESLGA